MRVTITTSAGSQSMKVANYKDFSELIRLLLNSIIDDKGFEYEKS